MYVFFLSPVMHPSGQMSRHILQPTQFFCRNFGFWPVRQLPVLLFRLERGSDLISLIILMSTQLTKIEDFRKLTFLLFFYESTN